MINTIITTLLIVGVFWLIYVLSKHKIKDEPFEDNFYNLGKKHSSYEKDLDKIFDYSKIKTTNLHEEQKEDDEMWRNELVEEKRMKNVGGSLEEEQK